MTPRRNDGAQPAAVAAPGSSGAATPKPPTPVPKERPRRRPHTSVTDPWARQAMPSFYGNCTLTRAAGTRPGPTRHPQPQAQPAATGGGTGVGWARGAQRTDAWARQRGKRRVAWPQDLDGEHCDGAQSELGSCCADELGHTCQS